jgi:hypothetical protein
MTESSFTSATTASKVSRGLAMLLAFGMLASLSLGALWLVKSLYDTVSVTQAAGVFALTITPGAAVASVFITNWMNQKRDVAQALRRQKLPMYTRFMEFWFKALAATKDASAQISDADKAVFFREFSRDLVVFGSSNFIREYGRFKANYLTGDTGATSSVMAAAFEDLLFKIREDVGQDNDDMKRGDILRLFINGLDDELSNLPQRPRARKRDTDHAPMST